MTDERQSDAAEPKPEVDEATLARRRRSLYPTISEELEDWMKEGWADTEIADPVPIPQADNCARRRDELSRRFPGERLVIPSGGLKVRANDTDYPFRAGTAYVHLTGDQTENAALVLEPREDGGHDATAYLLPRSNRQNGDFWRTPQGELWVGRRYDLAENAVVLGLPCADSAELPELLKKAKGPVRVLRGLDPAIEQALADKVTAERDAEFGDVLDELRLVKDDFEIAELRSACDSTVRGFEDVVRTLDQAEATSERYIEGTFFLRARVEGNDVGYGSICAAGPNATTLHWVRNDGPVRRGDLLLLDAGVETRELYTADVTRTLPISGRFEPLQRKVYDAVYDAQEAGIAEVMPGKPYRAFHEVAQRVLAERLVEWGLLEMDVDKVLELGLQRRWSLAGTGHMLGLDVHDCTSAAPETYVEATLVPGMCLTVEPGLYFQPDDVTVPEEYRGIGVRIEDDILVTADGHENLSAGLPRQADEIEAWMARLRG